MTSAINLVVPDFYQRLFDPTYAPEGGLEGPEGVWFPATDDEFEQMLAEFEAQDAALQAKQFWDGLPPQAGGGTP